MLNGSGSKDLSDRSPNRSNAPAGRSPKAQNSDAPPVYRRAFKPFSKQTPDRAPAVLDRVGGWGFPFPAGSPAPTIHGGAPEREIRQMRQALRLAMSSFRPGPMVDDSDTFRI